MIGQFGGRRLAVAAGNAHHLGIGVTAGKLNLAHDGNTLLDRLGHHGCSVGDTGALHYLVSIKNFLGSMSSLFPCDVILVEQVLVGITDAARIAQPDVHALDTCEHRCTCTALATAQYY